VHLPENTSLVPQRPPPIPLNGWYPALIHKADSYYSKLTKIFWGRHFGVDRVVTTREKRAKELADRSERNAELEGALLFLEGCLVNLAYVLSSCITSII